MMHMYSLEYVYTHTHVPEHLSKACVKCSLIHFLYATQKRRKLHDIQPTTNDWHTVPRWLQSRAMCITRAHTLPQLPAMYRSGQHPSGPVTANNVVGTHSRCWYFQLNSNPLCFCARRIILQTMRRVADILLLPMPSAMSHEAHSACPVLPVHESNGVVLHVCDHTAASTDDEGDVYCTCISATCRAHLAHNMQLYHAAWTLLHDRIHMHMGASTYHRLIEYTNQLLGSSTHAGYLDAQEAACVQHVLHAVETHRNTRQIQLLYPALHGFPRPCNAFVTSVDRERVWLRLSDWILHDIWIPLEQL